MRQKTPSNSYNIFGPKTLIVLLLSILTVRLAIFHLGLSQNATASDLTIENIMVAINKERELRNLQLLKTDFRLSNAAQFKSDDMQARHYFSHTNPEGEYIWPKIVENGYTPYVQLGENLAIEFFNTESLVSAWMNSPTHRANVLQENFKDQGMGLAFGNSSQNQYHSAITNTFGTLVVKKAEAVKTEPKPQVQPATTQPAPKPAAEIPKPAKEETSPIAVASKPQTQTPQIAIRSGGENEPSFALPQRTPASTSTSSEAPIENSDFSSVSVTKEPLPGVKLKQPDYGRYVTLAFGAVILLALFYDLKEYRKSQGKHTDKKLNNIILLALALVVIGMFYWK